MGRIADPLREYINSKDWSDRSTDADLASLVTIAGRIDREHDGRMEQCRRETKRAFARYLRAVIEDYERGRKREVRTKANVMVVYGQTLCECGEVLNGDERYCPACGSRLIWKEVSE